MAEHDELPNMGEGVPASGKRDILKTPVHEASEMESLIRKGHQSHVTVITLTFIGVGILASAWIFYNNDNLLNKLMNKEAKESVSFARWMGFAIERDRKEFSRAIKTKGAITPPTWPLTVYRKLRLDMFVVAGMAVLLGLVFALVEKTKMRRQDLLVYRALAREVEKLRLRVRQLEGKQKPPAGNPAPDTPAPPVNDA